MENLKYILNLFFKYFYPQIHNISIFFNPYLLFSPTFIFIIGLVFYFVMFYQIKQEKRIQQNILNMEPRFVLYELIEHKLHIKNIYLTLFKVFIYLIFTFLIYLGIRVYMLNSSFLLSLVNPYEFLNHKNFIVMLLLLLFLGMFRLFLHWILYKDVLRIYIYFSNSYNEYLVDCITYLDFPSWRPGNFLKILYFNLSVFFISVIDGEKIIILFNKDMKNIFIKCYSLVSLMRQYTEPIIKETAWITLLIALIYDITQQNLYYIYFASFIYLIRIIYRKIGEFIYQLDVFKDKTLHEYMYKTPYKPHIEENEARLDILNELQEKNGSLTPEQQKEYDDMLHCYLVQLEMDSNRENFIEYVKNDLVENKVINKINLKVRKFVFLLMSLFCYIYLLRYTEIIITIKTTQEISFHYHNIILFLVLIITYCWYKNNIKHLNISFWIISIIIIIFTFIIFLNHNIPLMYTDVLLNNYYINIIDYYTIEEKVIFIQHYISVLLQNDKETQEYLLKIIKNIPLSEFLQKNTNIITMKTYVENLILMHRLLEDMYTVTPKMVDGFPQIYILIRNVLLMCAVTHNIIFITKLIKVTYALFYKYPEISFELVKSISKFFK